MGPSPVRVGEKDRRRPENLQAASSRRLFEEYGDRIYRFCLVRLRSREEAEDAVQNTFLRVHRALRQGQTPRREDAWLFQIARNVCISRSDASRRRTAIEVARDPGDLECAAHEPAAEALIGLPGALAAMPANLRTAFLLREWRGLSYAEISETMETSVSAVETLIVRARRRLAAELERAARSVTGIVLPLAARLRAALVASAPAKVAAGTALLAVGAAGFGAAVVGTSAPRARPARAPASAPAAARPVPAVLTAPARPRASTPHRAARTAAAAPTASAAAPAPMTRPSVTSTSGTTAAAVSTVTTAAVLQPLAAAPSVSVPPLPPVPALPVSTDIALPTVSTDVQVPALPPVP